MKTFGTWKLERSRHIFMPLSPLEQCWRHSVLGLSLCLCVHPWLYTESLLTLCLCLRNCWSLFMKSYMNAVLTKLHNHLLIRIVVYFVDFVSYCDLNRRHYFERSAAFHWPTLVNSSEVVKGWLLTTVYRVSDCLECMWLCDSRRLLAQRHQHQHLPGSGSSATLTRCAMMICLRKPTLTGTALSVAPRLKESS